MIHTVGPVWQGGNVGEEALLASCYRNSLALAAEHGIRSIAFPGISTGVYGYPRREAAETAVQTVREGLLKFPSVEKLIFVAFDEESFQIYRELLK